MGSVLQALRDGKEALEMGRAFFKTARAALGNDGQIDEGERRLLLSEAAAFIEELSDLFGKEGRASVEPVARALREMAEGKN